MIKRLKQITKEFRNRDVITQKLVRENEWANIYHDSIRGNQELESLPLNVGRWAGNYSFFYVLNRIMSDYKPKKIIEFGLGESSKFISTFAKKDSSIEHHIIEHDANWVKNFSNRFQLSANSTIKQFELLKKQFNQKEYNGYANIESITKDKFNLYIVDGPFGAKSYSRIDILLFMDALTSADEFIIILDDYDRQGEKETARELLNKFKERNIQIHTGVYSGYKSQFVITSLGLQFITSM